MTHTLAVLLAALVIDRIVGDPPWLWRRIPHPVVFFGRAIAAFDLSFNRRRMTAQTLRFNGTVAIAVLLAAAAFLGYVVHVALVRLGFAGAVVEAIVAAVFLAQKSLADHVSAVAAGLRTGGLEGGRRAVSMIVGRDPAALDEAAVGRAAIESLAENFSDGVVAPAFWYLVLGLPGLLAYKMLNTADSMIGHRNEKYADFGRASARLDDFANLPAARISIFFVAAGAWWHCGGNGARAALDTALRDSGLHRSPNSGWPEAAMAGALGIQLAGPRVYGGQRVEEPMINSAGRARVGASDIEQAMKIFLGACSALSVFVLAGLAVSILL
ncbi:MAG: adenosylcobinamide-phosphate synthase CbiB [Shinella sp.]|nr:adenosylcobinamide-phosphate synthase CbiB [Shinella sp.]